MEDQNLVIANKNPPKSLQEGFIFRTVVRFLSILSSTRHPNLTPGHVLDGHIHRRHLQMINKILEALSIAGDRPVTRPALGYEPIGDHIGRHVPASLFGIVEYPAVKALIKPVKGQYYTGLADLGPFRGND